VRVGRGDGQAEGMKQAQESTLRQHITALRRTLSAGDGGFPLSTGPMLPSSTPGAKPPPVTCVWVFGCGGFRAQGQG
jgi:hypothetical protein